MKICIGCVNPLGRGSCVNNSQVIDLERHHDSRCLKFSPRTPVEPSQFISRLLLVLLENTGVSCLHSISLSFDAEMLELHVSRPSVRCIIAASEAVDFPWFPLDGLVKVLRRSQSFSARARFVARLSIFVPSTLSITTFLFFQSEYEPYRMNKRLIDSRSWQTSLVCSCLWRFIHGPIALLHTWLQKRLHLLGSE